MSTSLYQLCQALLKKHQDFAAQYESKPQPKEVEIKSRRPNSLKTTEFAQKKTDAANNEATPESSLATFQHYISALSCLGYVLDAFDLKQLCTVKDLTEGRLKNASRLHEKLYQSLFVMARLNDKHFIPMFKRQLWIQSWSSWLEIEVEKLNKLYDQKPDLPGLTKDFAHILQQSESQWTKMGEWIKSNEFWQGWLNLGMLYGSFLEEANYYQKNEGILDEKQQQILADKITFDLNGKGQSLIIVCEQVKSVPENLSSNLQKMCQSIKKCYSSSLIQRSLEKVNVFFNFELEKKSMVVAHISQYIERMKVGMPKGYINAKNIVRNRIYIHGLLHLDWLNQDDTALIHSVKLMKRETMGLMFFDNKGAAHKPSFMEDDLERIHQFLAPGWILAPFIQGWSTDALIEFEENLRLYTACYIDGRMTVDPLYRLEIVKQLRECWEVLAQQLEGLVQIILDVYARRNDYDLRNNDQYHRLYQKIRYEIWEIDRSELPWNYPKELLSEKGNYKIIDYLAYYFMVSGEKERVLLFHLICSEAPMMLENKRIEFGVIRFAAQQKLLEQYSKFSQSYKNKWFEMLQEDAIISVCTSRKLNNVQKLQMILLLFCSKEENSSTFDALKLLDNVVKMLSKYGCVIDSLILAHAEKELSPIKGDASLCAKLLHDRIDLLQPFWDQGNLAVLVRLKRKAPENRFFPKKLPKETQSGRRFYDLQHLRSVLLQAEISVGRKETKSLRNFIIMFLLMSLIIFSICVIDSLTTEVVLLGLFLEEFFAFGIIASFFSGAKLWNLNDQLNLLNKKRKNLRNNDSLFAGKRGKVSDLGSNKKMIEKIEAQKKMLADIGGQDQLIDDRFGAGSKEFSKKNKG
jgi:hypothetical protein